MKKLIAITFSLGLVFNSFAQDAFEKTVQIGSADEIAYDALEYNGAYLVGGYYSNGSAYKSFLAEVSISGTVGTVHEFGASNDNGIYDLEYTSTGDIIAAGYSTIGAKYEFMVLKINGSDLSEAWESGFVDNSFSWAEQSLVGICEDVADGNYVVAGVNWDVLATKKYAYFAKVDSTNGDTLWTKSIDSTGYDYELYDVASLAGGGVVGVGYAQNTSSNLKSILVITLDANGNTTSIDHITGSISRDARAVITDETGITIAGFNSGTIAGIALRMDYDGNIQWEKTYPFGQTSAYDYFYSVSVTVDKGFLFAGHSEASNSFLLRVDSSGNKEWDQEYNNTNKSLFNNVIKTEDNGYLAVGYNTISNSTQSYIVKMDAAGEICNNFPSPSIDLPASFQTGDSMLVSATVAGGNGTLSYNWNLNGNTSQSVSYKEFFGNPGDYIVYVSITDNNGCFGEDYLELTVTGDTVVASTTDKSKYHDILLFPNPANNYVTFGSDFSLKGFRFNAYNVSGNKVFSEEISGNQLQLSGLPSGLYFFTILDPNQDLINQGKLNISHD